jgi:hypothetical protein
MTHCDRCKGAYKNMMTTETKPFQGGTLTVRDIPARQCECDVLIDLGDGVIVDGYKSLLEKNKVIGSVDVTLAQLKVHYTPMDFISPHLAQQQG